MYFQVVGTYNHREIHGVDQKARQGDYVALAANWPKRFGNLFLLPVAFSPLPTSKAVGPGGLLGVDRFGVFAVGN